MNANMPGMKTGWLSIRLPQYRPHPVLTTYSIFSYEDLPPIRENLDNEFHWLMKQPIREHSLIEGCYADGSIPDLTGLPAIIKQVPVAVPSSFSTFIGSTQLHERVRSCTDCYLDVADRAVVIRGAVDGYLIHFLSDSQWIAHWYLGLDRSGREFVVASWNAFGFEGGTLPRDPIDLAQYDAWFCATSFVEFIYRFWIENEIWFALARDKRPLTPAEQAYVDHYSKRAK